MTSPTQALVYRLIASQLQIEEGSIEDTYRLDELGLDPLDLLLLVLRLESFDRGAGDFPIAALGQAGTVGDLVALVQGWLGGETTQSSVA